MKNIWLRVGFEHPTTYGSLELLYEDYTKWEASPITKKDFLNELNDEPGFVEVSHPCGPIKYWLCKLITD